MIYQFEFSEAEANVILEGLHELPMKKVVSIVAKMRSKYAEQVQKAEAIKELKIEAPEE